MDELIEFDKASIFSIIYLVTIASPAKEELAIERDNMEETRRTLIIFLNVRFIKTSYSEIVANFYGKISTEVLEYHCGYPLL